MCNVVEDCSKPSLTFFPGPKHNSLNVCSIFASIRSYTPCLSVERVCQVMKNERDFFIIFLFSRFISFWKLIMYDGLEFIVKTELLWAKVCEGSACVWRWMFMIHAHRHDVCFSFFSSGCNIRQCGRVYRSSHGLLFQFRNPTPDGSLQRLVAWFLSLDHLLVYCFFSGRCYEQGWNVYKVYEHSWIL